MKEDKGMVVSEVGPDLAVLPHVLPLLMAGAWQQLLSQQEQLSAHLATCCYCRTAIMVWHRQLIEAYEAQEYERLGMYAEALVDAGPDGAAARFPDIAAHLRMCPDCRSALEATITSITTSDEID